MVRDADVRPAARASGGGEVGNRRRAIRPLGMHMQGAAHIGVGHERRERPPGGRLDLTDSFPDLGLDEWEVTGVIDLTLIGYRRWVRRRFLQSFVQSFVQS